MYGLGTVGEKVTAFTQRVVKAYAYFQKQGENIASKQLYRSGTSIGANCSEATFAQSRADFISKLHIALKEANETAHWIDVLHSGGYMNEATYTSFKDDCVEICKLLSTIIINAKAASTPQKPHQPFINY